MKEKMSIKKIIGNFLLAMICISVLVLSIRGMAGNPKIQDLNTLAWKDNGPLELSPERGRYLLMYSIVENHSFSFAPDAARFAAPDVGYINGKYVSIFAPTVSFLVIPGYVLGKLFGLGQIGAFAVIGLFALINVFLIRAISIRFGSHPVAATVGGLAFLFASPAFAYAVTLYQHHISTFLILMSVYLLLRFNSVYSLIAIWFMCALSTTIDYPNFVIMLPIGIAALGRTFVVNKDHEGIGVSISIARTLALVTLLVPLAFFVWFNKISYGNPMQLSGTVERAIQIKPDGKPLLELEIFKAQLKAAHQQPIIEQGTFMSAFRNRDMLNGFYTLFLSPDRGVLWYTPVVLLGIAGIYHVLKRNKYVPLLVAIMGFNVLLYAMWGDPYGGWAFGARYLIPSYAILSIFIGVILTKLNKYNIFLLLFFAVFSYSVAINTLGAITSNRNPPQVEAIALERQSHQVEEYTYVRNIDLLNQNISKSFIFQTYAKNYLSAWSYYIYLTTFIIIIGAFLLGYLKAEMLKGDRNAV